MTEELDVFGKLKKRVKKSLAERKEIKRLETEAFIKEKKKQAVVLGKQKARLQTKQKLKQFQARGKPSSGFQALAKAASSFDPPKKKKKKKGESFEDYVDSIDLGL